MKKSKPEPIPVMDYRQYRRARRLVHECCNYDGGNCIALDDGKECVCVQSISYSLGRLLQILYVVHVVLTAFETVYFWPDLPQCFREVYRVLKPGGTLLICNESNGDTDKDKKWTEIIGGMTIYKDAELKTYLEQAGFHDVQIHKKKSWLCITARK